MSPTRTAKSPLATPRPARSAGLPRKRLKDTPPTRRSTPSPSSQFTETEIALAKPAPEPEPEDDGYVALDPEKAAALAAFIDENGIYTEGSVSTFYLLPAFYAVDDTRTMEVDLVHYPDDDKLVLVCGRALSENDSEELLTVAILTLNNAADKYFTFTDENGVQYYMNINAPKFAFSLNPPATVWSENYLDMTAYKQDDDTEADSAIRDRMVVELKGLLLDFQGVTTYWGLDIGVDDIGFTMHDFGDDLSVFVLEDGSYIDLAEAAEELAG